MRCIFSFVNFGILACESMNVFLHMSRMYDNFSILQQIFYLLGICDKLYLDRCLNHSLLFVRVIQIRLLRCVDSQLRFSPAYSLTIWNMLNYMKQSIFVCLFVSFDFDLVHSTTTGYRLPLNPFLSITSDRFTLIGAQNQPYFFFVQLYTTSQYTIGKSCRLPNVSDAARVFRSNRSNLKSTILLTNVIGFCFVFRMFEERKKSYKSNRR